MSTSDTIDLQSLTGHRLGPYLSYNPVSRVQIWQWCSAMGDQNPLYLDQAYQRSHDIQGPVAPPAMMQMWTMRDVRMEYAPGSTDQRPYQIFDTLTEGDQREPPVVARVVAGQVPLRTDDVRQRVDEEHAVVQNDRRPEEADDEHLPPTEDVAREREEDRQRMAAALSEAGLPG